MAYGSQVAFELDALGSSVNNIVNAQISSGAAIADSKLAQITTAAKVSGAALTLFANIPSGAGTIPSANLALIWSDLPAGTVLQTLNTQSSAVATGTTVLPIDDTIPQITEGDQYLSLAITPKATTTKLRIDVVLFGAVSASGQWSVALFQDATANGLASAVLPSLSNNAIYTLSLTYYMAAGTTSATTFRVRAGPVTAGTFTLNGSGGNRFGGGTLYSSLTITEIKA